MGTGEDIVSSLSAHPYEKLVGVFEYMEPGYIWDEHNIVFVTQDGEDFFLYHYISDEDTKELAELHAAFEHFKAQGIILEECPVQVIPPPFYSRVLYPPEDLGKKVYLSDTKPTPEPVTRWAKIVHYFIAGEPTSHTLHMNEGLSFAGALKTVTIKRWQSRPIPLYE